MAKGKLESQHKRVMTLIQRDANPKGWATVSKTLYPIISKSMPAELVQFKEVDGQHYARLTHEGIIVLKWWDRLT